MNPSKFNEINHSFNQLDPNSSLGLKLDYTDLLQTLQTSPPKSPNSGLADKKRERENELAATPSSSAQTPLPLKTTKIRKQNKVSASSDHLKNASNCFFHWDTNENEDAQRGWVGPALIIDDKIIPRGKIKKIKRNVESDSETENTKRLSL